MIGEVLKSRLILFSVTIVVLTLSFGPCNESLPTYQEPNNALEATIVSTYLVPSSISVQVYVSNIFDETLQSKAVFQGTLRITSARDSGVHKTFNLSISSLIEAKGYDDATHILTFTPGETIRLGVLWFFNDDNGKNLTEEFFRYSTDPQCKLRKIAYAEDFIIEGEITVFDKTAKIRAVPILHSFCYITADPDGCPPVPFPFKTNCTLRYPN